MKDEKKALVRARSGGRPAERQETSLDPEVMGQSAPDKHPELGDLVVEHLERIGVEYIFGVPGGAIEPLYNAMARSARRGGLRPIVARHETGAAFMADGYTRETGKLGVCCSTTGPGATNLITGVASAFSDNIPMLVITAQTALPLFGKRALQESSCTAVNTVAMFQSCTRFSSLVSHRAQLEGKLMSAIMAAQGPPAGPVHLSIPMDVLSSPRRQRPGEPRPRLDALLRRHETTNLQALDLLLEEVENARHIVLILGDDCGEAISHIIDFAEMVQAPIVSGPTGKRWVNHTHPLYRGVLGYAGHASAQEVVKNEEVDLILAVGTRLGEMVLDSWERDRAFQEKLIQIDTTAEYFTRSPMARLHVCGTLSAIFRTLNTRLHKWQRQGIWPIKKGTGRFECLPAVGISRLQTYPSPQIVLNEPDKCLSEAIPLKPQRLMRELSLRLPLDTRLIVDAGNSWAWATHYLHPRSCGLYRVGMGFGAMSWAIGTAVGTALGCPGHPVVALTGDGSYLMSGQEVTVAVTEKLPVVFVVLNDRSLGMVKHGQRLGGGEQVAYELPPVDFALVARAMGAQGHVIRTPEELRSLDFAAICRREGPTVLDVHIDGEEVPPMGTRMKNLRR